MRKLRHLRLSLVEGCLDTLRLTWEDARRRQLEQSSTDKLLSDFLQSPSDYTAVGLVTPRTRAGHPARVPDQPLGAQEAGVHRRPRDLSAEGFPPR